MATFGFFLKVQSVEHTSHIDFPGHFLGFEIHVGNQVVLSSVKTVNAMPVWSESFNFRLECDDPATSAMNTLLKGKTKPVARG